MKKSIVACLLISAIMTVPVVYGYERTAVWEWGPPATWEDGKPLVPSVDLSGFRLKCGAIRGGPYLTVVPVPGGTSVSVETQVPVGTTYCVVTAVTTSAYGSLESANSPEASVAVSAPASGACKTLTGRLK